MTADVCDLDELNNGAPRKEATFGAIYWLMVKFGFAWVYDRDIEDSSLYVFEDQARAKNLGLWQDKDPIAPWVWRKQK